MPSSSITDCFLVDASIYIFQSHFSPNVQCVDLDGNDVSATLGFIQFMLQFLRVANPQYIALAFDESLFTGFRHAMSDDYKSNRELPDPALKNQIECCKKIAQSLGCRVYASKKYEADDIIGILATQIRRLNGDPDRGVGIVTRDKDLAQLLINDRDFLWDFSRNRRRFRDDVAAEFGVKAEQIPDYLGLVGDAVDAIPGVFGIGRVKASLLLSHYSSIEDVYNCLSNVGELPVAGARKLQEMLQEAKNSAYLSKRLATIVTEIPDSTESFGRITLENIRLGAIQMNDFLCVIEALRFPKPLIDSLERSVFRLTEIFKLVHV
jgi:5'-3' exonuclease